MTKTLPCTCDHTDQDNRFGRGKRLHNAMTRTRAGGRVKVKGWRCTVCGREKRSF